MNNSEIIWKENDEEIYHEVYNKEQNSLVVTATVYDKEQLKRLQNHIELLDEKFFVEPIKDISKEVEENKSKETSVPYKPLTIPSDEDDKSFRKKCDYDVYFPYDYPPSPPIKVDTTRSLSPNMW